MMRILSLAAASLCLAMASTSVFADQTVTHTQLQKLFPGTFAAVVRGSTVTFTAKGNGVLLGQMGGMQDSGRWSVQNGKLCIMLTSWTQGKATCSVVAAGRGWYHGQGVRFRKI